MVRERYPGVKERPILFSAEMVRAILDGRKTQTRRKVKPRPPSGAPDGVYCESYDGLFTFFSEDGTPCTGLTGNVKIKGKKSCHWKCPYGVPGDRLWVRETFSLECYREYAYEEKLPTDRPVRTIGDPDIGEYHLWPHYRATDQEPDLCCEEDDCKQCENNGFGPHWKPSIHMPRWASRITLEIVNVKVERLHDISEEEAKAEGGSLHHPDVACEVGPITSFKLLWESINGPSSWAKNPWVWVVEFKRVS